MKPVKRRKHYKPRVMRLMPSSAGAIERLAATLAFIDLPEFGDEAQTRHKYRSKARAMLEHLAKAAAAR